MKNYTLKPIALSDPKPGDSDLDESLFSAQSITTPAKKPSKSAP